MQTTSKYKLFKLLTFSIIVALLLSLSAISNIKTAQANQDSDQLEINVKSNKVPQKVQQLAQQQYVGYAQALDKQHNKQSGKYQLGEPFNIYKFNGEEDNSYYYPILKDGKIIYTLTISPKTNSDLKKSKEDANYSVKISNFIANDLDKIKDKNSKITILTDEKGFYFEEDGKVKLVKSTPLPTNTKEKESSKTVSSTLKKQLNNTSEPTKIKETQYAENESNNQVQYENTLDHFKIREQQFDNSWCAGLVWLPYLTLQKIQINTMHMTL